MYHFLTTCGRAYETAFSPREIARMWCFDAFDPEGNRYVILGESVDFKSFEYAL